MIGFKPRVLALFLALCVSIAPGTQAFVRTFSGTQARPAGPNASYSGNAGIASDLQSLPPSAPNNLVTPVYDLGAQGLGLRQQFVAPTYQNPPDLLPIDATFGTQLPRTAITELDLLAIQDSYVFPVQMQDNDNPGTSELFVALAKFGQPSREFIATVQTTLNAAVESQRIVGERPALARETQKTAWDGGRKAQDVSATSQQVASPSSLSPAPEPVILSSRGNPSFSPGIALVSAQTPPTPAQAPYLLKLINGGLVIAIVAAAVVLIIRTFGIPLLRRTNGRENVSPLMATAETATPYNIPKTTELLRKKLGKLRPGRPMQVSIWIKKPAATSPPDIQAVWRQALLDYLKENGINPELPLSSMGVVAAQVTMAQLLLLIKLPYVETISL